MSLVQWLGTTTNEVPMPLRLKVRVSMALKGLDVIVVLGAQRPPFSK